MKVSYCSTCKGRLWQLKSTLHSNLAALRNIDAEWIILDYDCPDNVSEVLLSYPLSAAAIRAGKLKVYKVQETLDFSMPLAKNLAHMLGMGEILFNLDIDNYIGNSFEILKGLQSDEYCHLSTGFANNGQGGRIGLARELFYQIGGYDLSYVGYGYDDIDLVDRLKTLKIKLVPEVIGRVPIGNSPTQSALYLPNGEKHRSSCKRNHQIFNSNKGRSDVVVNKEGLNLYQGKAITPVLVGG